MTRRIIRQPLSIDAEFTNIFSLERVCRNSLLMPCRTKISPGPSFSKRGIRNGDNREL
jgi:hypothetical protein